MGIRRGAVGDLWARLVPRFFTPTTDSRPGFGPPVAPLLVPVDDGRSDRFKVQSSSAKRPSKPWLVVGPVNRQRCLDTGSGRGGCGNGLGRSLVPSCRQSIPAGGSVLERLSSHDLLSGECPKTQGGGVSSKGCAPSLLAQGQARVSGGNSEPRELRGFPALVGGATWMN